MSDFDVPFNAPRLTGQERRYVDAAIASGTLAGNGPFTRRCEELLGAMLAGRPVLLTTSCTHALEMCALLLELGPEDEVIVPSFAFVATAEAFALRGARIVFADVLPDTLCLDAQSVEQRAGPRTRAIVALHYGGVGCEMDGLMAVAERVGARLVEDNAHGLGGAWRGRMLGTVGALATLSFHETKNLTCGEGGALVVNDEALLPRAEIVRQKGTDRGAFERGLVGRYTWVDHGSSYAPSELQAAFLAAQLEAADTIQREREAVWTRYLDALGPWAEAAGAALPVVPPHCRSTHHVFQLLAPTHAARDTLIAHLQARGVEAVFHYVPLHLSRMGRLQGGRPGDCPVSEDISARLVRLPLFSGLDPARQDRVIEAVRAFAP